MRHTVDRKHRAFAKERRQLRTRGKEIIWSAVRAGRLDGFKFKREVPFGPYAADFSCASERLIIEVDGRTHAAPDRAAKDAGRDAWFAEQGFRVLRLSDDLVIGAPELAVAKIREALRAPSPDPASRGHPLPEREREEPAPERCPSPSRGEGR
jgi:very-short-patch-repair endonuclease